jgi:hypothetical protein
MTLKEITKSIARNIGQLSSNNETVIEGQITKAGLKDEINRIYQEIICQTLMNKSDQDFTVEARANTFRDSFIVASVDVTNKLINSTTGVFGTVDIGSKIQDVANTATYTIETVVSSTQVVVTETPSTDFEGETGYILTNILVLDGDLTDLKEVIKFQIKYDTQSQGFESAEKESPSNFKDISNISNNIFLLRTPPVFSLSTVKVNDKMQRCISYFPFPKTYNGEIRLSYTQLPKKLQEEDDEPALTVIGISNILVDGVTAWAFRLLQDPARSQAFEELFQRGMATALNNYKPENSFPTKYKGFKR